MDEKWLHDIANQLAGYESKAPEGLWERIDASLTGQTAGERIVPLIRRPAARTVAYWIAAVVMLLLLIGGGVLLNLPDEQVPPTPQLAVSRVGEGNADASSPLQAPHATAQLLPPHEATLSPASSAVVLSPDTADILPPPSVDDGAEEDGQQPLQQQSEVEPQPVSDPPARRPQGGYSVPAPQRTPERAHRPFSISLLATNMISDNSQTNGFGGAALISNSDYIASSPVADPIRSGYGTLDKHLIGNDGARIFDQEKHHRQPVRLGLSVAYPLSQRLSVGIGLCYTYLSSDFKSGSEHNYQSAHQSLHYLGIPLSLNYAFYRSSRLSFYGTGGVMGEKCVSGRTELLTVSGSSQEMEKQSLTERRLQYSVFGAVGMQVDLLSQVGLYVEPGISYYFDNHSRVVNIYKDEPLQFNLSAGVRFSF